jgi:hypothetical protein
MRFVTDSSEQIFLGTAKQLANLTSKIQNESIKYQATGYKHRLLPEIITVLKLR